MGPLLAPVSVHQHGRSAMNAIAADQRRKAVGGAAQTILVHRPPSGLAVVGVTFSMPARAVVARRRPSTAA